ncbi:MAG: serine/threonine-protein kinase [Acidimicrobiales bacterium]
MPIGSGGSSVVYRARQAAFDRLIALKVLAAPLGDDRSRRRFQRELAFAGRLTGHPNVVTVFASGFLHDGRGYVEMEYCPGGSLLDRLAQAGPLPVRDVVSIGIKLAGVLELARTEGIIHRDVKPANVLVTRYGEPALSDFGIATVAGEVTGSTQSLTPVHAAPEVLESREVGPAADQWSLASTLYTLLAGRAPFAGPDGEGVLAGMLRILSEPVPVIPRGDVPPALRVVLERALSKQAAARWPTPADLGRALQEIERVAGWPVTKLAVQEVPDARYGWVGSGPLPPGGTEVQGIAAPDSGIWPIPAAPASWITEEARNGEQTENWARRPSGDGSGDGSIPRFGRGDEHSAAERAAAERAAAGGPRGRDRVLGPPRTAASPDRQPDAAAPD